VTPETLHVRLRSADPPVVARIEHDHLLLDPRTILPGQERDVIRAVVAALDG
jgi:L-seryl-tRNA(Ser) seleniumtransferase